MKLASITSARREPLKEGRVIRLKDGDSYRITDLLSDEGGFSLTYLGKKCDKTRNAPLVVIKELFPARLCKRVDGAILCQDDDLWASMVHNLAHEVELARKAGQLFRPESESFFQSMDYLSAEGPYTDMDDGNHYVVYQTYKGIPLSTLIDSGWHENRGRKRNAQFPLILSSLISLTAKIHVMHTTNGIYHLDLSPSNIFLAPSDSGSIIPFLLDFGSSMDLNAETENINHLYSINRHWSAGELFPLAEYGSHCGFHVTPSTDTYSICAILFYAATGLYPDEAYEQEGWELLLQELYPLALFGPFAQKLTALLLKGLSPWSDLRYISADRLYEALKDLESELFRHKGLLSKIDRDTKLALSMMAGDPPHRHYAGEDTKILFWGTGSATMEIFKTAFHSQQFSDRLVDIAVTGEGATRFRDELLAACPDLIRFTNLGDAPEELYGNISFDTCNASEFIAGRYPDYRYVIISLGSAAENRSAAQQLLEQYRSRGQQPDVIYYVSDVVDRDVLHLDALKSEQVIRPCFFGSDPRLDEDLADRAFRVHCSYCDIFPEDMEGISQEMQSFANGSAYNQLSSAAAAIHTSAKLSFLGLPADISSEEWVAALEDPYVQARLITLEHRRWNAFMVTQGFRAPRSDEEVLAYAFQNGSKKFHSEDRKIHPCLVPSSEPLTTNLFDPSVDHDKLDALDQASLRLHNLADRIRQDQKPLAEAYLEIIAKQTKDHPACEEIRQWMTKLYQGARKDLDFDSLKRIFHEADTPCEIALEGLRQSTRSAVEYALCKNYKSFDTDIIHVVKDLL